MVWLEEAHAVETFQAGPCSPWAMLSRLAAAFDIDRGIVSGGKRGRRSPYTNR